METLKFVGLTQTGGRIVGHPQVVFLSAANPKRWAFLIYDGMTNVEVDPQTVRALAIDEQLEESERTMLAYKRALEART